MNMKLAFLTAILLIGCTNTAPLSLSDKKEIEKGKLIKFTDYLQGMGGDLLIKKSSQANGIYVCAAADSANSRPNTETKCFPKVSELIAQYLANNGVKISNSRGNSDDVLYFRMNFNYEGRNQYLADDYSLFSFEQSLEKNSNINLRTGNLGNIAGASIAGLALGATAIQLVGGIGVAGGGHYEGRHWLSIVLNKVDSKNPKDNQGYVFSGRYVGPRKISETFAPLFDEAMKETVTQVVTN